MAKCVTNKKGVAALVERDKWRATGNAVTIVTGLQPLWLETSQSLISQVPGLPEDALAVAQYFGTALILWCVDHAEGDFTRNAPV